MSIADFGRGLLVRARTALQPREGFENGQIRLLGDGHTGGTRYKSYRFEVDDFDGTHYAGQLNEGRGEARVSSLTRRESGGTPQSLISSSRRVDSDGSTWDTRVLEDASPEVLLAFAKKLRANPGGAEGLRGLRRIAEEGRLDRIATDIERLAKNPGTVNEMDTWLAAATS